MQPLKRATSASGGPKPCGPARSDPRADTRFSCTYGFGEAEAMTSGRSRHRCRATHRLPAVLHHSRDGLSPQHCGGIWGYRYLLEILTRCSVCRPGGVMQIQITLDGFPQVMLGITAEAAMLAAPVMIPVGGVYRAQTAQHRREVRG
jgi:hypothetical protein